MHPGSRWLVILGVVGIVATASPGVDARWKSERDVVHNSAYMLDPGEFMIGVFTPIHYGVTESFSIALHPIFELLLTPNLSARYQFVSDPVALTLAGSYVQTFIRELDEGGFPGVVEGTLLASFSLGSGVVLTPSLGYFLGFATDEPDPSTEVLVTQDEVVDFATRVETEGIILERREHGVKLGMGMNWVVNSANLLLLQASVSLNSGPGSGMTPQGLAMWAFAWDRARLGLGVALGEFPIGAGTEDVLALPAYPVLDLWIRL